MAETLAAKLVTYEDLLQIGVPVDWTYDTEAENFSFRDVGEDGRLMSAINIDVTYFDAEGQQSSELAHKLMLRWIASLGWEDALELIEEAELEGGPAATLIYHQKADQAAGNLSGPPGFPVLWQMWIVMDAKRFAVITQQITSPPEQAESYLNLGWNLVAQTFKWLD